MDSIDPNIPLQAGQNIPQYGMNNPGVQNALITAIKLQQANQAIQAQNALKAVYANPANYDPKTLQPTPEAMANLMRASPAAGMDVQNNVLAMQQKRMLSQEGQMKINDEYQVQAQDIRTRTLDYYNKQLSQGIIPQQAIANTQKFYTDQLDEWLPNIPEQMRTQVPKAWNPVRMSANSMTYQQQQAVQKAWEPAEDYGRLDAQGRPTKYWVNNMTGQMGQYDNRNMPYKPIGVGKPMEKPELYEAPVNGKMTTIIRGPEGGWLRDDNQTSAVPDTAPRKIGTQDSEAQTFSKPQMIEIPDPEDPSKTKQQLAQQITKGPQQGQWVTADAGREPLPTPTKIAAAIQGRQGAVQIQRLSGALNESAASLANLVQLPIGATAGIFQGLQNETASSLAGAVQRTIANELTPQAAQDVKVTFTGLQRNLAAVEAQGSVYGLVGLSKQMEVLMPLAGDSSITVMRKYAEMRQILDRATESIATNPGIAESQAQLFKKVASEVDKAVPYTVQDVTDLERKTTKNWLGQPVVPNEAAQDFAKRMLGHAQQGNAPSASQSGVPEPKSQQEYDALPPGAHYLYQGKVMVKP